jgi:hypothetical protein
MRAKAETEATHPSDDIAGPLLAHLHQTLFISANTIRQGDL